MSLKTEHEKLVKTVNNINTADIGDLVKKLIVTQNELKWKENSGEINITTI